MLSAIKKYIYFLYERSWIERFYLLKEGDVYIDCGAYLGELLPYASKKVGRTGQVFAIEPNTNLFTKINYENKNLTKLQVAVSNRSDEIVEISDEEHYSSIVSGKSGVYKVKTLTISDLIVQYNLSKVSLVKMNIEGAEIKAVEGLLNVKDKIEHIAISGHVVENINSVYPIAKMLNTSYHVEIKHRKFGKKEHFDLYATRL